MYVIWNLHRRFVYFPTFNYILNYFFMSVWVHAFFFYNLCYILVFLYFRAQLVSALILWILFIGFCVPLMHSHCRGHVFFDTSLLSMAIRYSRRHWLMSCPHNRLSYFSEDVWFFSWTALLECKIWVPHVLTDIGLYFPLGCLSWLNKEIDVCILTCICRHCYKNFSMYPSYFYYVYMCSYRYIQL